MSLVQEVELMRQVPMLCQLEPAAQKMLCFTSERLVFEPGQVLFRQGEAADAAYLVIEGSVEIVVLAASGSRVINTVGKHEILGETGLFGDLPRSATAIARTRLEALRMPADVFHRTIHDSPQAALHLSHVLAQRLASNTAQLGAAVG